MIARIILLISLTATNPLGAQVHPDTLWRFERRLFLATNPSEKDSLLFSHHIHSLRSGDYTASTLNSMLKINPKTLDSADRAILFWNRAVLSAALLEYYAGWDNLDRYEKLTNDSSISFLLLKTQLSVTNNDFESARMTLNKAVNKDRTLQSLDCLCTLLESNQYNKKWPIVASAIVPGSGLILTGYVGKGGGALLLNGALVAGTLVLLSTHLYASAFFLGAGVLPKTYAGNIALTKKYTAANHLPKYKKRTAHCLDNWRAATGKYPLVLKMK